jgi:hypothetical protein
MRLAPIVHVHRRAPRRAPKRTADPRRSKRSRNSWIASRGSSLYLPFHLAPPFPRPPGLPWRF